jgi:glycosyltransferase involved in cell wall biosynthesis
MRAVFRDSMFSIIIPVYNEEKLLEANVAKLAAHVGDVPFEIIIANNGSTDKTLDIATSLAEKDDKIKVITVDKKAPGLAFKKAAKIARGDILVSQDMDLSTNLEFIEQALQLMDKHDIVIGSKRMGRQERSFLRKLPSNIFIFLTNLLLGLRYEDYSMAAKAYRKSLVLRNLDKLDDGTSYVIELVYFARKAGKNVADIPVDCFDKRKSKFNIIQESLYRFNRLMALVYFRLTHR